MMDGEAPKPNPGLAPWLTAAAALILFAFSSSRLAVPEVSAGYLADALRLTPFPTMDRPLWAGLVRLLAGGLPAHSAAIANALSVLLGALAVGLLARLVARSVVERFARPLPGLSTLAGVAAGLVLATSVPFWLTSNRAHPATLGIVLWLGALNLMQEYSRRGRLGWLVAAGLAFSAGLAEWPALLLLAPVVAVQMLVALWQQHQVSAGRVFLLALSVVLTPLIWAWVAWTYARLPAASWREMEGFTDAFRYVLIGYRDTLLRSVPRQGWLILLFTSLAPWLVAYLAAKSPPARRVEPGLLILQILVTLLVVATILNAPLTPWAMMGTRPLLVAPYVLMAAAAGYLLVYWGAVLALMARSAGSRGVVAFLVLVAAGLIGVAVVRSGPQVSTRSAAPVQRMAETMLEHVRGRDVIITHGLLADPLRLLNHQQGARRMILDAPLSEYSGYRRYLASLFSEPRQQSLALAGLVPVLVDWLATDSNLVDRLAMQPNPDLWLGEGLQPVPMGTCFLGVRTVSTQTLQDVVENAERFWPQAERDVRALRETAPRLAALADELAAHWSRVANDTGVFFEHHGRREEARAAYAQARRLDADNVSAAANLVVLGQAAGWSGIDVEEADLALAVAPRDRPLGETIARHGHLRRREAAQLLGAAVTLATDMPSDADLEWRAAVEAYQQGDRSGARRRLEAMINQRPEFDAAWILLANLAYEQGDEATLQKCVRQMREARREWPEIPVLLGRLALDRGDMQTAREYLERAAVLRPSELPILEFLLQLDLRDRDYRRAENRSRQLLSVRPGSVSGLTGLGAVLRSYQRYELAEDTLRRVLEAQRYPPALAELALVLLARDRTGEARALAEEAVVLGPRLSATHEALGILLLQQGDAVGAADALMRSQALDPQRRATRVYLAAALQRAGRSAEASALAAELRKERHGKDRELDAVLANLP